MAAWRILAAGDRVGGIVLSDVVGSTLSVARRSRGAGAAVSWGVARRAHLALSARRRRWRRGAAARLNAALARAAEIVIFHDWLAAGWSATSTAPTTRPSRILTGIARGNDSGGWALVHDPSAHETPASGRIVVGDGRLQVELDLADARVRRNLAGGRR